MGGGGGGLHLIELHVKRGEVDEVEVFGALEACHAVDEGEGVCAHAVAGVSVGKGGRGGGLEGLESVLGGEALKRARDEARV